VDLIASATTVTLTFKYQKKDVRNETISHQRSGDSLGNREMCPVRAAVETVKRLRSFNIPQEKLIDTPINYIEIGGKGFSISSSLILLKIRQAVSQLGHSALGFSANKVGMHSNQSRGSDGDVLVRDTCVHNYVNGEMVIRRFHEIHKKTRIISQSRYHSKNAYL